MYYAHIHIGLHKQNQTHEHHLNKQIQPRGHWNAWRPGWFPDGSTIRDAWETQGASSSTSLPIQNMFQISNREDDGIWI